MAKEPCLFAKMLAPSPKTILTIIFVISYTLSIVRSSTNVEVQKICNQTSNPSFCREAFDSDPRTPGADLPLLANVAVRLAFNNASTTSMGIGKLVASAPASQRQVLMRCKGDYDKAVAAFVAASNDLNSESYFDLGHQADVASGAMDDCNAALGGPSQLSKPNQDVKGFSEIVKVVGKKLGGIDNQ